MREGFESRLSGVLTKALQSNGINPNGGEMNAIVAQVEPFFVSEVEFVVGDSKELAKVQAEIKAKSDAAAAVKQDAEKAKKAAPPEKVGPAILTVSPEGGQAGSTITIK